MNEITVNDIIKICNAELVNGNIEEKCTNFSKDTRNLKPGDTYIGIKGEKFDGNTFYKNALEAGAKVCILEETKIDDQIKQIYKDRTILIVKDTIKALQQIASYKRSLYKIPVIAVTGSVGKTSTKDIISSVVAKKYKVLKTQGNYNNYIGLPLTILGLKDEEALVVEMGMNSLGEISTLTRIARPQIALITNVGTAHIGKLGSRQNILKAKLEILEGLEENGILIINNDNDLLNEWNKQNKTYNVIGVGIENKSDINAKNIHIRKNKSIFIAMMDNKELEIEVPVLGNHFIYNAMCAIAVGKILEIEEEKIIEGIKEFELTKGRMEIIENKKGITIINDCYNANVDSMKAGIEALRNTKGNKKIAVLGDMLELGQYSKQLHEQVGAHLIKNNIDILVTVGNESKYIAQVAKEKLKVYQCNTNEEAIQKLEQILNAQDVVLIKASNGMHFTSIVEALNN